MSRMFLLVSAFALAPVMVLADHSFGPAGALSGSASAQCALDPTACTTVERARSNR
jgi:hypothetical protein